MESNFATMMPPAGNLTRRKRLGFLLVTWGGLLLALLAVGEFGARLEGFQSFPAYPVIPVDRRQIPGVIDPDLGYRYLPGSYRVTYAGTPFAYQVTNLQDGLRRTHPADVPPREQQIWILGCSITYGQSLNDEETYPWRLQAKLPNYEVVNFGVGGYSTVQSLIQFRRALAQRPAPRVAVLAYGSLHDERNAALRSWRKWNQEQSFPYARFDADGQLHYRTWTEAYREFPLMRYSAFINLLERHFDELERHRLRVRDISAIVLQEVAATAREHHVPFVLAGIMGDAATAEMLGRMREQGIMTTDISVDLEAPGNTNLPYDGHPSAQADRVYADRLQAFLVNHVLSAP